MSERVSRVFGDSVSRNFGVASLRRTATESPGARTSRGPLPRRRRTRPRRLEGLLPNRQARQSDRSGEAVCHGLRQASTRALHQKFGRMVDWGKSCLICCADVTHNLSAGTDTLSQGSPGQVQRPDPGASTTFVGDCFVRKAWTPFAGSVHGSGRDARWQVSNSGTRVSHAHWWRRGQVVVGSPRTARSLFRKRWVSHRRTRFLWTQRRSLSSSTSFRSPVPTRRP